MPVLATFLPQHTFKEPPSHTPQPQLQDSGGHSPGSCNSRSCSARLSQFCCVSFPFACSAKALKAKLGHAGQALSSQLPARMPYQQRSNAARAARAAPTRLPSVALPLSHRPRPSAAGASDGC